MITYSLAVEKELEAILNLLSQAALPTDDININIQHFIIAKSENSIVGCIGLEDYSTIGFLRSFAVDESYRNRKEPHKSIN